MSSGSLLRWFHHEGRKDDGTYCREFRLPKRHQVIINTNARLDYVSFSQGVNAVGQAQLSHGYRPRYVGINIHLLGAMLFIRLRETCCGRVLGKRETMPGDIVSKHHMITLRLRVRQHAASKTAAV